MKNQFVPYELAIELKQLGFDEECLSRYIIITKWEEPTGKIKLQMFSDANIEDKNLIKAPLWQQAFDWFREGYKINSWILPNGPDYTFLEDKGAGRPIPHSLHNTYEEARQACLLKLIELCQQKK